jgi:hypothetical protein
MTSADPAQQATDPTSRAETGLGDGVTPVSGSIPHVSGSMPHGTDIVATDETRGVKETANGEHPAARAEWAHFAPTDEPGPSDTRLARTGRRTWATVRHEWFLAALACLAAAAAWDYKALAHPTRRLPLDLGDPALVTYQIAWGGHALKTDPGGIWLSNSFFPGKYTYAFTETFLGYLPAGMIGDGPTAAILRYNLLYWFAAALTAFGAYALVRQLGSGWVGAAVAGAAWAFAPWRLSQAGHLHIMSTGGMALALAMLARGHGWSLRPGYRPEKANWRWVLAGWSVAAWQMLLGFGIGLVFAYVLAGIGLVSAVNWLRSRHRGFGRKLLFANVGGGLIFAAACALGAWPLLKVVQLYPYARRTSADLAAFSPPLRGFFIAPVQSWLWGDSHEAARASLRWAPEMTMLPGYTLYALALAGLVYSIWTVRQRVILGVATVLTFYLAMGTTAPSGGRYGYLVLFDNLPGFDSLRTPGRLIIWATLLMGILAAGTISAFGQEVGHYFAPRVPGRPWGWLQLAMLIPLVLVLIEGANRMPAPEVPQGPAAMAHAATTGPILVLPTAEVYDEMVMLWSTNGFPTMVNGGGAFVPRDQAAIRQVALSFPSFDSITALKQTYGIQAVVVVKASINGSPYRSVLTKDITGLPVTRTDDGETVTFQLR